MTFKVNSRLLLYHLVKNTLLLMTMCTCDFPASFTSLYTCIPSTYPSVYFLIYVQIKYLFVYSVYHLIFSSDLVYPFLGPIVHIPEILTVIIFIKHTQFQLISQLIFL